MEYGLYVNACTLIQLPLWRNILHRRRRDVYETKAYHHWCLATVIVEEGQKNTAVSSPGAFIPQSYQEQTFFSCFSNNQPKSFSFQNYHFWCHSWMFKMTRNVLERKGTIKNNLVGTDLCLMVYCVLSVTHSNYYKIAHDKK